MDTITVDEHLLSHLQLRSRQFAYLEGWIKAILEDPAVPDSAKKDIRNGLTSAASLTN